ncbi:hypothetical protein RRG08_066038 [Elysia crispata]|uniref:Uncharacterized protein n=1 Tax=Elysia crispata TaxID=231223 RepID=A0AAE0Y2Q6_9GAST|nr:hypothetical protein RRG08_066038 [Elysia crispata]
MSPSEIYTDQSSSPLGFRSEAGHTTRRRKTNTDSAVRAGFESQSLIQTSTNITSHASGSDKEPEKAEVTVSLTAVGPTLLDGDPADPDLTPNIRHGAKRTKVLRPKN